MKLTVKKRITSSNETDAMTEPVLSPSDLVALLSKINELYDYEIRVMMDEAGDKTWSVSFASFLIPHLNLFYIL